MKKFLSFIIFIGIIAGAFYLVRDHDRDIPLTREQISLLDASYYTSLREFELKPTTEEQAIMGRINSLRQREGLPALEWDSYAHLLAVHHSALMRQQCQVDFELEGYPALDERKTYTGISDTCFYSLYADTKLDRLLSQLETDNSPIYKQNGLSYIGIGVVKQLVPWQYWVTVIYIKRLALIEKFPVHISEIPFVETLNFKLLNNYHDPHIKMTTPDGGVKETTVTKFNSGIYGSEVLFSQKGKHIIEILAQGDFGVEVAHIMPVYVQTEREKVFGKKKSVTKYADTRSLEIAMVAFINKDRAKYNIKPLKAHTKLTQVARIHSSNMAQKDTVVHELPGCPKLGERIKKAGLKTLTQGENVASDDSIEGAQENLMNSPGHRQALLDPDYTHVGVGIIKKNNNLYITQNFASFIPEVASYRGKRDLIKKINALRSLALKENTKLSLIAKNHSNKMARVGKLLPTSGLVDIINKRKIECRKVYFQVISALTLEQIITALKKNPKLISASIDEIGIGLRQAGNGVLWVTVILKK